MMRRENGRVIGGWRPVMAQRFSTRVNSATTRATPPADTLGAERHADADDGPHQESQGEPSDIHEQPFQDIGVPSQI